MQRLLRDVKHSWAVDAAIVKHLLIDLFKGEGGELFSSVVLLAQLCLQF